MGTGLHEIGSRAWWVAATVFFLGFEMVFRMKLGSIYVLATGFVLCHQWLSVNSGHQAPYPNAGDRIVFALYCSLVICAVIFLVFAGLNIGLRTINNDWQWFQLP